MGYFIAILNREYTGQRPILFQIGVKFGEKTVIKINPKQSNEIEDVMRQKFFLLTIGLRSITILLLFKLAVNYIRKI